jgi:hypothetical protein
VRATETSCPFCDSVLPDAAPIATMNLARLGRAAVFVAGTALVASAAVGCGDKPPPRDPNLQKPYGAPPADGLTV